MASSKALDLLSFDNIVFSHYAFYTSAVLLKVLGLGLLTSMRRMQKKVCWMLFMSKTVVLKAYKAHLVAHCITLHFTGVCNARRCKSFHRR